MIVSFESKFIVMICGPGYVTVEVVILSLAGAPDNSVEFCTSGYYSWVGSVHPMTVRSKKQLNPSN